MDELNKRESVALEIMISLIENSHIDDLENKCIRYTNCVLSSQSLPKDKVNPSKVMIPLLNHDVDLVERVVFDVGGAPEKMGYAGVDHYLLSFNIDNQIYWFYYDSKKIQENRKQRIYAYILDFYSKHVDLS